MSVKKSPIHPALPAFLMASAITVPALAEDSPASSYNTDTVVVTGTRQNNAIGNLAGNDTMVGQKELEFTAPIQPNELLNQMPGVIVEKNAGIEHFTAIRSPAFNGQEGAASFLYLEDGVPMRAAGFAEINGLGEANIEQAGSVELIRGPGSALYGSNAMHGMLNIIPRDPSKTFTNELDVTGGVVAGGLMNGQERVLGTTSGTIDNLGMRLSAEDLHEDGWRKYTGLNQQKWAGRSVWTGVEDTVTTNITGERLDERSGSYAVGTDAYRNNILAAGNSVPTAYRLSTAFRAMSRWQHDISDTLQISVTPYTRNVNSDFMINYLPTHAIQKNEHTSGGVQMAAYQTLDGGHLLIAGTDAEYTDGSYSEYQPTVLAGAPYKGWHYKLAATSAVIAPYVHSEWQLLEHTKATLGARVESTTYDYTNDLPVGANGTYKDIASRSDTFVVFTPKFGLVQQWTPTLANYLNLSIGSRAPQVTDLYELQQQQTFGQVKPERMQSAETGMRGNWGSTQFDTAAYWMVKDHYFYRNNAGYNVPNGVTWHRGVELQVKQPLGQGFDLGLATSYSLNTFEFYDKETGSYITSNVKKNSLMPNAPREQADVRLGYAFYHGARAELEWQLVGPYVTDQANTHSYGGYSLFNLRTEIPVTEMITFHARIDNVANVKYAERATVNTTGTDQYFPGQPLTIYSGVTLKF